MIKLFKTVAARESKARSEKHVSHFIPYKCHWDDNTILTKKNELLQVVKISGFSFETADDEDLDLRKNMRNSLLKTMASGNIILYFHTIRRRKTVSNKESYTIDPTIKISNDFITYLSNEWRHKHNSADSFFNELYVSIMYRPDAEGAAIIEYFLKKLQQKSNKGAWEADMREMKESLQERNCNINSV